MNQKRLSEFIGAADLKMLHCQILPFPFYLQSLPIHIFLSFNKEHIQIFFFPVFKKCVILTTPLPLFFSSSTVPLSQFSKPVATLQYLSSIIFAVKQTNKKE